VFTGNICLKSAFKLFWEIFECLKSAFKGLGNFSRANQLEKTEIKSIEKKRGGAELF